MKQLGSSFRDPNGFMFQTDGVLYRQVNKVYQANYEKLIGSGLYEELTNHQLLIPHEEVNLVGKDLDSVHKVIQPEKIRFISYPYEWCFSQLKDAALTTLDIQKLALSHGMWLKDANAYNIQFQNGRPILIDTLSLEEYPEGEPWVAYRQFCQHFLAPLALMSFTDVRLHQLLRIYMDGIPLDLASRLLPFRSRFSFSQLLHIHLHSSAQKMAANHKNLSRKGDSKLNKNSLLGLIDSLYSSIRNLEWKPLKTSWGDYGIQTSYSIAASQSKSRIIQSYLSMINPVTAWDLGSNDGYYSRFASDHGVFTVAMDSDPVAVEKNYSRSRKNQETCLLPLLVDLTNPSPNLGWNNQERDALLLRNHPDLVMALAIIHHLAIGNNLGFEQLAKFFNTLCQWLIVEFVPKSDPQVVQLLSTRKDIYPNYSQDCFERIFCNYFQTIDRQVIEESTRVLYLLKCLER